MRILLSLIIVPFISACSGGSNSDTSENTQTAAYRLTTKFTGNERPLGIETDANGFSRPILVSSNGESSQEWVLTRQDGNLYQLSPRSSAGNTFLAVKPDERGVSIVLETLPNNDSELWEVTSLSNGYCRFTSQLLGPGSSLDIVNSDVDRELTMAVSGDFTGQSWQLEMISGSEVDEQLAKCAGDAPANEQTASVTQEAYLATASYRRLSASDFVLLVNPKLDSQQELLSAAMIEIYSQLSEFESVLSDDVFSDLQKVPIWVEADQLENRAGQFHRSATWLSNNGYNPDKAGAVEISNLALFTERSRLRISSPLIHELSHARRFFLNDESLGFESTYQSALASGKYDSVLHVNGSMTRAYSMTNAGEYFAELSEAYFATNDYFPFNRSELLEFDPEGYQLIKRAWKL